MVEMGVEPVFSEEETDLLQEVMNIALGSAAADLAEVIDIFVVLSVPSILVTKVADLPEFIKAEVRAYQKSTVIEQNFYAKFKGLALLIFPAGAGDLLTALFDGDKEPNDSMLGPDPLDSLEKETLLEVGNILIGACVSKIAELLGNTVIYSPPRVIVENRSGNMAIDNLFDPGSMAVTLRTVFHFQDQEVSCFLFLICNWESISWLKKALNEFLKPYQ